MKTDFAVGDWVLDRANARVGLIEAVTLTRGRRPSAAWRIAWRWRVHGGIRTPYTAARATVVSQTTARAYRPWTGAHDGD